MHTVRSIVRASTLVGALFGCEGPPAPSGAGEVVGGLGAERPSVPRDEARTERWATPVFEARRVRLLPAAEAGPRRVTLRVADPDGRTFSVAAGPGEPVEFAPMSGDGLYRYELIAASTLSGGARGDGALSERRLDAEMKAAGVRRFPKQFGVFRVIDGQIVDPSAEEVSP